MKMTIIEIKARIPQSEASVLDNLTKRYNEHKNLWKFFKAQLNGLRMMPTRFGLNSCKIIKAEIDQRIDLLQKIHDERETMDKIAAQIKDIVVPAQKVKPGEQKQAGTQADALVDLLTDTAKVFGITLNKTKTDAIMKLVSLLK